MHLINKTKTIYRKLSFVARELSFPYRRYNKRHKCIFIHVPRVAGTSILWALGKKRGGRDHLPWYVYKTANPNYYDRAFKFAFVRNPWDRAFSAFKYLQNGGNGTSDVQISRELKAYCKFTDFVIKGLGNGLYRNHLLFLPQSDFVVNGEGEVVVDFLGRYESIEEDCGFVFKHLGINYTQFKKSNAGASTVSYKNAYENNESLKIIAELYKQDIRIFGYSF